jgi:hypothetical protein
MDTNGYCRKGGLDYVRMFVTPTTASRPNESTQFLQELDELDHYFPEQRDAYEGRFWRICRLTATQAPWLRGYLLDADRRPLTDARLAARLHLDLRACKATLAALKKVGLLEYVPCPEFNQPPQEPEEDVREPQEPAKETKGGKGRPAKKGRKTGAAASIRDDSETFRNCSEPLIELTNGKSKSKSNGQRAEGQAEAQTNPKGVAKANATTSPTSTPSGPVSPPEVTMPEGRHPQQPIRQHAEGQPAITPPARVSPGPTIAPLHPQGDGVRMGSLLGRVVAGSAAGYAIRADEFADEIFALLRAPFDRDSREGQRERENYRAALLDAVDAGLGPGQMDELIAKARTDAAAIAKHRKRHYTRGGSPEKYWRFLFNKHLDARCGPRIRAGPASVAG